MVDICQLEKMLEGGLFGDGLLYGDKGFKYCGRKILTAFTDNDAGDKAQRCPHVRRAGLPLHRLEGPL